MLIRNSIRLAQRLCTYQQHRTAVVLKRFKTPTRIPSMNATQEEINKIVKINDGKNDYEFYRYEVVTETDAEPGEIKIILLKSSEEFGMRGQIRTLNAKIARQELLLPGFAVYASPGNLEKYKDIVIPEDKIISSSESSQEILVDLTKKVFAIVMSGQNPWTLEPKHIRFALMVEGLLIEEDCVILPSDVKIEGPNSNVNEKEFAVDIQINEFEKVTIRCVLFQESPDVLTAGEIPPYGWEKRFYNSLIDSQADMLKMLPRHHITAEDVSKLLDGKEILRKYAQWKSERDKRLFSS